MSEQGPRRRQARGERRIEQILDATAHLFAEVGYEAATTNAIAARAGMSPGSLYQFFPNKEAIAEALAARYIDQLQLAQETAFGPDLAQMPLDALFDRIVDPFVSFNLANPGFQVLFNDSGVPVRVAKATQQIHDAVVKRVEAMIAARAPTLPAGQRFQSALVSVQLFRALLPLILSAASADERALVIVELKKVLRGYLAPLIGEASPAGPAA
ncbi:MAG TPA: TetR/AcrR family transcriptional regulator [Ktedonobacterales bacterium]|nr:TetR/AcrR family transcriptional regulator [Ktedonobacterales bacterium]